jgi:hypothetical protein
MNLLPLSAHIIREVIDKCPDEPANISKMMGCIKWRHGYEPLMILDGRPRECDVVAESILELPFICAPIKYAAVTLIAPNAVETLGFECDEGEILSCYDFIDWLNNQNLQKQWHFYNFSAVGGNGILHISCYCK